MTRFNLGCGWARSIPPAGPKTGAERTVHRVMIATQRNSMIGHLALFVCRAMGEGAKAVPAPGLDETDSLQATWRQEFTATLDGRRRARKNCQTSTSLSKTHRGVNNGKRGQVRRGRK